ncbi:MAG: hypothetical protein EXS13_08695 [Planctomycetes bacterium]|nr:hypothetical protein [Planctomycetota bacterium]
MNQASPESFRGKSPPAAELAAIAATPESALLDGLPPRPRRVERVMSSTGPLARKRYVGPHGARQLEREWRTTMALFEAGVVVAEPVARVATPATLFLRWIEGGCELATAWDAAAPAARRALARKVGDAIGELHRARFAHGDLHARNVVVDATGKAWLIDLGNATRAPAAAREGDWCALYHHFAWRARTVDRLRALVASGALPIARGARRAAIRRLSTRAETSRQRFLRHHERRCDGSGRAFKPLVCGALHGVARRDAPAEIDHFIVEFVADVRIERLCAGLARCGGVRVHATPESELWRCDIAGAGGRRHALAIKWFDDRGPWRRSARGSRARRAWRNTFRLQMAEAATPIAWLYLESRAFTRRPQSVWVGEFVVGAEMLHESVARLGTPSATPTLAAAARLLARLHDEGISHRDLKAENILVAADGQPILVDLDGVARRKLDLDRVARDLMRLNASFRGGDAATMRARLDFLAAYRAARRRERPPFRELARRVAKMTGDKWQHATTEPR